MLSASLLTEALQGGEKNSVMQDLMAIDDV